MKSLFGIVFGWFAGVALAGAMIGIVGLFDAGVEHLGFTENTARYYILSLMLCITMLVMSKPARRMWKLMGLFGLALFLIMGTGLTQGIEPVPAGDQVEQIRAQLDALGILGAKAVMYLAPGGLVLFYTLMAYIGMREEQARKRVYLTD
ncbi:TPA: hypothetical protein ACNV18_000145 [Pseudomonas putida]|jgi:hypothetical protein|uniref:Uncharacterized protein n=3 Tax=Pseudomonas TaxID=286 RepID=A0A6B7PZW0_9PSED|nr:MULTISPECIES: hypothetical protein [Pseudomonas]HBO8766680.1 hypothetical protein [Pseudomonas aeruginosa]AGZ37990.1 putative transmembrane protein [Pseudomonas sp. VLB120]EKT4481223.1 hypothetical protein [Pseudomonas putida]MBA6060589.1 hypothetical protein [Pseudomonas juntendi]MCE0945565.1 hypothetical protein [Pseudomonas asiatica]